MRLGTTVGGRYRLLRGPLRGGTGEVWLARDLQLGRRVALKRVLAADGPPGTAERHRAFDRLRAEARALARFSHPHVVTLYGVEQTGRGGRATFWLVMEYVSGGSLADRAPLTPARAARVGTQIADALAALHTEGLVHGDVKPGNVVVTPQGLAKLADFGAAYRVGGAETITPNGAVSYTPDYAAPEAVRGRPEPASDVFSLGALLHTLVTGRPPRPGLTDDPALADVPLLANDPGHTDAPRHIDEDPDPYLAERQAARGETEIADAVGPLGELLAAILDRDPRKRPDAARARGLLEELAGPQEPLAPATTDPNPEHVPESEPEPEPEPEYNSLTGDPGWLRARWGRATAAWEARSRPVAVAVTTTAGLALVLAVVVSITQLGGTARENDKAAPPEPTTERTSVVGDHRTADPCALADPATLARFGDAELDRAYGNFDRCDILVDTGSDSPVDVEIHFEDGGRSELSTAKETVGGVAVADEPAESGTCGHTLLPAGDPDVNITVIAKQDEATAPLCAMARSATDHAVSTLNAGRIARRSPPPPADSLVQRDACTLLDADALDVIPGVDARDPLIGFGNWACEWESTTSDLWVELRFDRGRPLSAQDGTPTRIGGHDAAVEPDGEGDHSCLVRVVHRSYRTESGDRGVETLNLAVGGDRSAEGLRRLATELATAATAKVDQAAG
ncbi:protein kinase [Streptomyces sp. NPDC058001]|uniref:serine/threonine-protein kinase n=1 Tax=Streptomyces sp. NPDC058001 TaxID=3346300 RepID=UPI0036ECEF4C